MSVQLFISSTGHDAEFRAVERENICAQGAGWMPNYISASCPSAVAWRQCGNAERVRSHPQRVQLH
eukprot:3067066-Amphidinium_carterae.1